MAGITEPMRLYLIRHGQTAWNAEERAQGHTDIPLDDTGHAQSECLRQHFLGHSIDLVLTSDLQRSSETAIRVAEACGAPMEKTPLLRERSFGEWEGLPYTEFARRSNDFLTEAVHSLFHVCPPGGESIQDAWDRVRPITERLAKEQSHIAVVAHGGVCSLMLAQLLKGNLETSRSFRFLNCAVTELLRRPDGAFSLLRYNDIAHLELISKPAHAKAG